MERHLKPSILLIDAGRLQGLRINEPLPCGRSVLAAEDGEAGIELAKASNFALALTLPRITGY